MSRSNDEEENQRQLGRRRFLRIGTLGAAALAAGAAGQAKAAPDTETPGDARQTPPAQGQPAPGQTAPRPASQFKRNFDPVPASALDHPPGLLDALAADERHPARRSRGIAGVFPLRHPERSNRSIVGVTNDHEP